MTDQSPFTKETWEQIRSQRLQDILEKMYLVLSFTEKLRESPDRVYLPRKIERLRERIHTLIYQ